MPLLCLPLDPAVKTRDEQLTPLHFAARYIPIRDTPQQEHEHDNTHLSSSRKAMEYLVTECKKVDVNCKVKRWGIYWVGVHTDNNCFKTLYMQKNKLYGLKYPNRVQ